MTPTEVALGPLGPYLLARMEGPAGPPQALHEAMVAGYLAGQGLTVPETVAVLRNLDHSGGFLLSTLATRGVPWYVPGPVAGAPWYYHADGADAGPRAVGAGAMAPPAPVAWRREGV